MTTVSWLLLLSLLCVGAVNAQRKFPAPSKATESSSSSDLAPTSEDEESKLESRSQTNEKRATATATTTSASTTTTTPAPEVGSSAIYRQRAFSGSTCTLIRVDAELVFKYVDYRGEEEEANLYVPETATVTGSCSQEDFSFCSLRWETFALNWYFAKTPGGERWYLEKMEVKFNTSERAFERFPKRGRAMKLTTPKDKMQFPTPVGKAYACDEEMTIQLTGSKDMKGSVLLRDLKLQPFIFKNDEFGPEFVCSPGQKSYRDESAPLAVGSTLAVVVLLTVTGYGVYRYFKIKKVQYDTME